MDLNADIAEFDDIASVRAQEPMYRFITSANIACGGHAGTVETMREAVELCVLRRVSPGAHPSYEDREGFGRGTYDTSRDEVRRLIEGQTGSLIGVAATLGVSIRHVKAHGTLYHDIAHREDLAVGAVLAMLALPGPLRLVGPPDCILALIARDAGIPYITEGFADRRYGADGRLLPRSHADALIHDPDEAASQALRFTLESRFQTICIHADHPGASDRLERIHQHLTLNGATLGPA